MKVFVYYNLHKKLWSVKALDGPNKGRVVRHANAVCLANAIPKVSRAGRLRVLLERCKNVHAGITGELLASTLETDDLGTYDDWATVTYNPYLYETFVYTKDKKEYTGSKKCIMIGREVFTK